MKKIGVIITLLAFGLMAQVADKPAPPPAGHAPKDPSTLVDLWVLLYRHQSQNSAFQSSLSDEQKKMIQAMNDLQQSIEKQKKKICTDKEDLDMTNPQLPLCVPLKESK